MSSFKKKKKERAVFTQETNIHAKAGNVSFSSVQPGLQREKWTHKLMA